MPPTDKPEAGSPSKSVNAESTQAA
jgi:hypothetical protein